MTTEVEAPTRRKYVRKQASADAYRNTVMSAAAVMAMFGWSRNTLADRIKDRSKGFPLPFDDGAGILKWLRADIDEWIAVRKELIAAGVDLNTANYEAARARAKAREAKRRERLAQAHAEVLTV